jgi:DNA-binding MarR family transcriptional regulator
MYNAFRSWHSEHVMKPSQILPPTDIAYGSLPGLLGYNVRKAYSRLFQTFTDMLRDLPLAPGQYGVLLLISMNPGMSQNLLADATGIDRSAIAPITNRFARFGWIRRTRRSEDRRFYSLEITPKGQDILNRAQPLIEAHEDQFVSSLTATEEALATTLLARIADSENPRRIHPDQPTSNQSRNRSATHRPRPRRTPKRP